MQVPFFNRGLTNPVESQALPALWNSLRLRHLGNHINRFVLASLGSGVIPAAARTVIMRKIGFDVSNAVCIWSQCDFRSRNVTIGEEVFINVGFYFDGAARLRIGRKVRIGQFVRIITASHEIGGPDQRCTTAAISEPVSIEDGCWIGACVTIMPGVTIRRGCVIGAGSIVLHSTEPDGLYVGTPARRAKDLPL